MTTEEIIKKLEPWLAKHRRPAWRPVVEDGDGPAIASKFCGTPWVGPDAAWPDCGHCDMPLQLFLQLDLGNLPEELGQRFGAGLLQLFYCTRDECRGGRRWEPFDEASCVRVVQPSVLDLNTAVPQQEGNYPAKQIIGWNRFLDLPEAGEHGELGLTYVFNHKAKTLRVKCEELGLAFENITDMSLPEQIAICATGDKLAGWPAWVQFVEYPTCPRCGRRMVGVFQVDSEDNVPFMFGDVGCGHVTQCPEHKEVVAFGWSCS